MRRSLPLIAAACLIGGLVTVTATPAGAVSTSLSFSPVAGPVGTVIDVQGYCDATTASISLAHPTRSDAIPPPVDSKNVTLDNTGHFSATLTNNAQPNYNSGGPADLEVKVFCSNDSVTASAVNPFASTPLTTQDPPTIITGIGPTPCGYGFGPSDVDRSLPCPAHVKGFNAAGAINNTNFYVPDWVRGANVAIGDINHDDQADIVAGTGPGMRSGLSVLNKVGLSIVTFDGVYGDFHGGVNVAVGDVNGDGTDDIITGAGPGGGPHVQVLTRDPQGGLTELASFFAYGSTFTGGVTVAAADLNGDGTDEIITGAGAGGGPHVRTFHGDGTPIGNGFFAYSPDFHNGINVAGGNVTGDANAEIITGAGPGGGPHVRAFNADGTGIGNGFYAYDPNFGGGVEVAVGQANGTGGNDIVTGPQTDGGPHVRIFTDVTGTTSGPGFFAYESLPTGVRVAVVP